MKAGLKPKSRRTSKVAAHGPRRAAPVVLPIVGIGASAGGLEALEKFLMNVPPRLGAAFVIVQHLDPTHKGMLAELLRPSSPLPVLEVKDGMRLESKHVYVIPPNKDLWIAHGILHLLVPAAPRGMRLPIDFFFRSLAEDARERSIGVVLSGMGSDGTLGLRAIRDKAGSVFVQAPASAKFASMPRSAIDAGVADVVAPVEELPGKIADFLRHTSRVARPERPASNGESPNELVKIIGVLRLATGHDFSLYKRSTLARRVERRMGLHQIDKLEHYVRFLRENPRESELLFKELLIGVTSFFREPAAWKLLRTKLLPELLSTWPKDAVLRAWVPACSTGEEAYSLAIVFREAMERCRPRKNVKLQIFATDIDGSAIERARTGRYSSSIAAEVSPRRLSRFFIENDVGYRVKEEIRDPVIFAVQNIVQDPPFTKIDLLSCRNLLIYLTPELQKKLIPLFHYSLNPGGILFLGSAEGIGTFTKLFTPLDGKMRLYRRLGAAAGAVAGRDYQHGLTRTRRGEAKAPAAEPDAHAGSSPSLQALRSEEEFMTAHEELESTNEELQSTNEELTTSKEEMQSMNEELQSLNIELQAKVDALSLAGNDMKNLLDSIELAVLFLDEALNVRRFTPQVTTLFKLIPSDIGRPLADLASDLVYPALYDDAREVLRTLVSREKASSSQDGRRFRVRVMPYRTIDNRIDGVVITFTNIHPTPRVNLPHGGP